MRTRSTWVLTVAVVLGSAAAARADITAVFEGVNPYQAVNVAGGGASYVGESAGAFQFKPTAGGANFTSFCADFTQSVVPGGTYTFQEVPFDTLPSLAGSPLKAERLQSLYDHHYVGATSGDAGQSAAFQLAQWEIMFDGGTAGPLSLANGGFTASGAASSVGIAQGWLNTLDDKSIPAADSVTLTGLYSPTAQDQITGKVNPVPAPAGLVLLGLGAGTLLVRRKLAAKKATVAA